MSSLASTPRNDAVFVTGTDTGIGKSLVSATLLAALNAAGRPAVGMKPVASGCAVTAHGLRNEDAELLITHSAGTPAYDLVNPYAFVDPIAPHLAAADTRTDIELARIDAAFADLAGQARFTVVEGVGGWMAPLGPALMQCNLARALRLPVVLVVGLRLGCLNHALLSARAIRADGCELRGWVANRIDADMLRQEDNLATLKERLDVPCIGTLPFAPQPAPRTLAQHLDAAVAMLTRDA